MTGLSLMFHLAQRESEWMVLAVLVRKSPGRGITA